MKLKLIDHKNVETGKIYLVSADKGYTWFPVRFLWIGKTTHVWSNSIGGVNNTERCSNNTIHYWKISDIGSLDFRVYEKPELETLGLL